MKSTVFASTSPFYLSGIREAHLTLILAKSGKERLKNFKPVAVCSGLNNFFKGNHDVRLDIVINMEGGRKFQREGSTGERADLRSLWIGWIECCITICFG